MAFKKVENNQIQITSQDKLKIFESTDYEKSILEYDLSNKIIINPWNLKK